MNKKIRITVIAIILCAVITGMFMIINKHSNAASVAQTKDSKNYIYVDSVARKIIQEHPQAVEWIKPENIIPVSFTPLPLPLVDAVTLSDILATSKQSLIGTGLVVIPAEYKPPSGVIYLGYILIWREGVIHREYVKAKYFDEKYGNLPRKYVMIVLPESPL